MESIKSTIKFLKTKLKREQLAIKRKRDLKRRCYLNEYLGSQSYWDSEINRHFINIKEINAKLKEINRVKTKVKE